LNAAIIFLQIKSDVIEKQLRKKEDKVKFAIGMIVSHSQKEYSFQNEEKRYHYGVIIGWHYKFNLIFLKELMKSLKFPYHFRCADIYLSSDNINIDNDIDIDQPHYIILSENNRICYWQQGTKIYSINFTYTTSMIFHLYNVYIFYFRSCIDMFTNMDR